MAHRAIGRCFISRAAVAALMAACGGSDELPASSHSYPRPAYTMLSQTGLYADVECRTLADDVEGFAPKLTLWADDADKERWLRLPPDAVIDTTEMDRWVFPIGTRAWKQFSLGGRVLETRLIERYGPGREEYWMGAFVWDDASSDATYVEAGQADLLGTPHDAPSEDQCWSCHNGEPGRLLGVSALQLAPAPRVDDHDSENLLSLDRLARDGVLSVRPTPGTRHAPPGDDLTSGALGYLHANCGHCHNSRGTAWPDTRMVLRLSFDELTPPATPAEQTRLYQSIVGTEVEYFRGEDFPIRVVPGHPEASAVIGRMQVRGPRRQMPPIGTEAVDATGVDLVSRWIAALPEARSEE